MARTAENLAFCGFWHAFKCFLVYLSIWKGLEVAKNHEKYEVFACQGHDPRDSCRIMSFLVVLPDGFWAVAGFSQTKSRLLAFPGQKPEIQESIAKSTILVLLWGSPHFGGLGSGKSKKKEKSCTKDADGLK